MNTREQAIDNAIEALEVALHPVAQHGSHTCTEKLRNAINALTALKSEPVGMVMTDEEIERHAYAWADDFPGSTSLTPRAECQVRIEGCIRSIREHLAPSAPASPQSSNRSTMKITLEITITGLNKWDMDWSDKEGVVFEMENLAQEARFHLATCLGIGFNDMDADATFHPL